MTQQQLGQMLGVHPMTVSKWERDDAKPTPYNVQQLLLVEEAVEEMGAEDQRRFRDMIVRGLFVGALAFVVGLAMREIGQQRGWW